MSLESSSSFSRYGHRDERRRRLLADDLGETIESSQYRVWSENGAAGKTENYGDAEFLQHQRRLSDLIPRRFVAVVSLPIAGAALIAGLEIAYVWMCRKAAVATAFDVGAKGSLACWFSSLLLLAAAVGSLLVYSIRRYRTDDYQGRYRVWLWAAGLWFLAATDLAASLHQWFQSTMISLTGTTLAGDGAAWWMVVYVILFGAIGSRLFIDVYSCRLSTLSLAAATIACGLALSTRWNWAFPQNAVAAAVFSSSCAMAACLLSLLAVSLQARYVLLDAEGLLPPRPVKQKPLKIASTGEDAESKTAEKPKTLPASGNTWRKVDPPQPAPQPPHQPTAAPAARAVPVHPAFATSAPAAFASVNRKLTKGERKALKERLLRERREREARSK